MTNNIKSDDSDGQVLTLCVPQAVSRRRVLTLVGIAPALGMLLLRSGVLRAEASDCAKDDTDSAGLRTALDYHEVSPDREKRCATCAYFTAPSSGACGTCKIFNGPSNVDGHCTSWTLRK